MAQINNKFTAYWIDTTTAPWTPLTWLSATITIREATSPYAVVVNSQSMDEIWGWWYIYTYSWYDSTKDYIYDCNPWTSLAFIESWVTSQSIWNDDIAMNSSIVWSFWNKFSTYWGVSHVIREIEKWWKWFTEEEFKFLKEINERLKAIENKEVWERIIEVTKIEKIPIQSLDTSTITDVITEWLWELAETLSDSITEGLLEIKNK